MRLKKFGFLLGTLTLLASCSNAVPLINGNEIRPAINVTLPEDVNPTAIYEENFNKNFPVVKNTNGVIYFDGTVSQNDWEIRKGNFSNSNCAQIRASTKVTTLGYITYKQTLKDVYFLTFTYNYTALFGFNLINVVDGKENVLSEVTATTKETTTYTYHFEKPTDLNLKIQLTNPDSLDWATDTYRFTFDDFGFYTKQSHHLTYMNGTEIYYEEDVYVGDEPKLPADPTKEGDAFTSYEFDSWYTDQAFENEYDFSPISEDTILYAHFNETTYTDEEVISSFKTLVSLSYEYTLEEEDYTFSNVALRFGGLIEKSVYDRLKNITGFGVLLSTKDYLKDDTIKDTYEFLELTAEENNVPVDTYYQDNHLIDAKGNGATPFLSKDSLLPAPMKGKEVYVFNAYLPIPDTSYNKEITAAAYIIADGKHVFFQERTASVCSVAEEYYDLNDDSLPNDSLLALATL